MILLEPETWMGKEFPLFSRFADPEGAEILRRGTWDVLLVQPNCSDCKKKMAELEGKKSENVAIVIIPSRDGEKMSQTAFPTYVLDRQNGWGAQTPYVIRLGKGVCVAIEQSK